MRSIILGALAAALLIMGSPNIVLAQTPDSQKSDDQIRRELIQEIHPVISRTMCMPLQRDAKWTGVRTS